MCDTCVNERHDQLEATSEGEDTDSIASGRSTDQADADVQLPSLLSPKWRERNRQDGEECAPDDDLQEPPAAAAAVLEVTSTNDANLTRESSASPDLPPPSPSVSSVISRYISFDRL